MKLFKFTCGFLLLVSLLFASGIAPQAYSFILDNGTVETQRSKLNLIPGANMAVSCVDNVGALRTDCTFTASTSGGTALANYRQTFTTQTSVVLTHNAGTSAIIITCVDASSPPVVVIPQNIAYTDANNATVTFANSQSGACTVNSSGVSTGGGLVLGIVNKSAAYTATSGDWTILCDTTAGSFSIKLEASPTTGQTHNVKKIAAANTCTVDGNGQNIDGAATQPIAANNVNLQMQYDGTQWRVL
jgi:hypothetical protein